MLILVVVPKSYNGFVFSNLMWHYNQAFVLVTFVCQVAIVFLEETTLLIVKLRRKRNPPNIHVVGLCL